jgi:hypothetical protein
MQRVEGSGVEARKAAFVVVIVLIVGAMGLISFASQSGRGATSSSAPTNTEQQTSTYSTDSPSGLQLHVELNTTTIQAGSALRAQIALFNPLTKNLSVIPSSSSSIATWDDYDFFCGGNSMQYLAGYALFKGHQSSANISSIGDPLTLVPPVGISCVQWQRPSLFVFLPNSSDAIASYPAANNPPSMVHLTTTVRTEFCKKFGLSIGCPVGESLIGYWSSPIRGQIDGSDATTNSSYFHYLSPGQYTLAVQDTWGQTVYAYFHVVSTSGSPVEVVSVTGPIPPYNPGGPVVGVTLRNIGTAPITSLAATLPRAPGGPTVPHSFVFNVSYSNPLQPGQSIQETRTLIGAGFDSSLRFPLTVNGSLANGTRFSFVEQINIVPPG